MASVTSLLGPRSSVSPLLASTAPLRCGVLQSPLFSCGTPSWWSHFLLQIYKHHLLPLASNIFSCLVLSSELHEESQYVWTTKCQTFYPWELLPSENGAVSSISFISWFPLPMEPCACCCHSTPCAYGLLFVSFVISKPPSLPPHSVIYVVLLPLFCHLLICSPHSL